MPSNRNSMVEATAIAGEKDRPSASSCDNAEAITATEHEDARAHFKARI